MRRTVVVLLTAVAISACSSSNEAKRTGNTSPPHNKQVADGWYIEDVPAGTPALLFADIGGARTIVDRGVTEAMPNNACVIYETTRDDVPVIFSARRGETPVPVVVSSGGYRWQIVRKKAAVRRYVVRHEQMDAFVDVESLGFYEICQKTTGAPFFDDWASGASLAPMDGLTKEQDTYPVERRSSGRLNALHAAINDEDAGLVEALIEAGANINLEDSRGRTATALAESARDPRIKEIIAAAQRQP